MTSRDHTDHDAVEQGVSRRVFVRGLVTLGGLAAGAALLEGCARVVEEVAVATAVPPATPIPANPTAIPPTTAPPTTAPTVSVVQPTLTMAPQATATLAPTVTSIPATATAVPPLARVAFVKTRDRAEGVRRAMRLLGVNAVQGKSVILKPNFNSADPTPGSTHPTVLRTLVQELQAQGASRVTVVDRSGMGVTRQTMEGLGVFSLGRELGFETLVLDELGRGQWELLRLEDSHWQNGFPFPRPCLECDALVQTCNLKTHRFGGHFTLSLKNSVGLVGKTMPGQAYNYMTELHGSPHQRRMIAEINTADQPALVVMDGVEAFVNGGPDTGKKVWSEVVLAGTDRVALDAVGVALLRYFGTTPEVSQGPIFGQEQLARAIELGLGISGADQIQLVTDDPASAAYAAEIQAVLAQG
ncbi:MAG: DUF362 domain-containing protein [Anaerolineae bacterium]|nr:DUF362 domain-containing protein [Anaerolineae bacterium]